MYVRVGTQQQQQQQQHLFIPQKKDKVVHQIEPYKYGISCL